MVVVVPVRRRLVVVVVLGRRPVIVRLVPVRLVVTVPTTYATWTASIPWSTADNAANPNPIRPFTPDEAAEFIKAGLALQGFTIQRYNETTDKVLLLGTGGAPPLLNGLKGGEPIYTRAEDLPEESRPIPEAPTVTLADAVEEAEKQAIMAALSESEFHRERASELLDVSIRTLHYKMSRYGLH